MSIGIPILVGTHILVLIYWYSYAGTPIPVGTHIPVLLYR